MIKKIFLSLLVTSLNLMALEQGSSIPQALQDQLEFWSLLWI